MPYRNAPLCPDVGHKVTYTSTHEKGLGRHHGLHVLPERKSSSENTAKSQGSAKRSLIDTFMARALSICVLYRLLIWDPLEARILV